MTKIIWRELGIELDYQNTIMFMEQIVDGVINHVMPEQVLILEHCDTYTAGSMFQNINLEQKIEIIQTNRGGGITYHGPGQLVIYPILDLAKRSMDIRMYIMSLCGVVINFCRHFGINAFYDDMLAGVWVMAPGQIRKKIASIGIRVQKWVTYHGIAVNISTDLSKFAAINPCGLNATQITSLEALGISNDSKLMNQILKTEFYKIFI